MLARCHDPHLDAVGFLNSEHFAVLLGSCDGHCFKTHHLKEEPERKKFTAR